MTQEKNTKPIKITKKVHRVNNKTNILRTNIPTPISQVLELTHQDNITWVLTTHDDHWQVSVQKANPQDSDDHE